MCCFGMILRAWRKISSIQFFEGIYQEGARDFSKFFKEASSGLKRIDRNLKNIDDVALIHSFAHEHYSDTSDRITRDEAGLDRRSSAIFRQYRAMDIDAGFTRHVEDGFREDSSVCHDYEVIDRIFFQCLEKFDIVFDFLRLEYGNIVPKSEFFYGGWLDSLMASDGPIWLRYDKLDIDVDIPEKRIENSRSERWGSEKANGYHKVEG